MSKKEAALQGLGNGLMMSEFFRIIRSHRVERETQGLQQGHDRASHGVGASTGDFGDEAQA